jgi:hypothetical protein
VHGYSWKAQKQFSSRTLFFWILQKKKISMEFTRSGKVRAMMFACRPHVATSFYPNSFSISVSCLWERNVHFLFIFHFQFIHWILLVLASPADRGCRKHQLRNIKPMCRMVLDLHPSCNQPLIALAHPPLNLAFAVHFMLAALDVSVNIDLTRVNQRVYSESASQSRESLQLLFIQVYYVWKRK